MPHNVCVSSVVRFRSRALSPTQNVERRYELWATRYRTIEETFCCMLGRVNPLLLTSTCFKSTVAFCWRVRVHVNEFWVWNRVGVHVDESVKAVQALRGTKTCPATPSCPRKRKKILFSIFLIFLFQTAKKFALRAISISALGRGRLLCRLKSPCSKSSEICA